MSRYPSLAVLLAATLISLAIWAVVIWALARVGV